MASKINRPNIIPPKLKELPGDYLPGETTTEYFERRAEVNAENKELTAKYEAQVAAADKESRRIGDILRKNGIPDFKLPPESLFGKIQFGQMDGPWLTREGQFLCTPFEVLGSAVYPDRVGQPRVVRVAILRGTERVIVDLEPSSIIQGYGRPALAKMMQMGLRIAPGGDSFIADVLAAASLDGPKIYDAPGWQNGEFLDPHGRHLTGYGKAELSERLRLRGQPTKGTLMGWTQAAGAIFSSTCWPHQAAIALGLAGAVVDVLGAPSILYSWEGASTYGKSTLQQLQVSPWADPKLGEGLFISLNSTVNGLETPIARASGTTIALDEAHNATPKTLVDLAFVLEGGRGKARAKVDGTARETTRFRCTASISGEVGIAQKLRAENMTAAGGLGVRVLAISVDEAPRLSDQVWERAKGVLENFGHAGQRMVSQIAAEGYAADPAPLAARIAERAKTIATDDGRAVASPYQIRGARLIATVVEAAELAKRAHLLPAKYDSSNLQAKLWEQFELSDLSAVDPLAMAIDHMAEALASRRGIDVVVEAEAVRSYRQAIAWRTEHSVKGKTQDVYVIRVAAVSDLTGGAISLNALKRGLDKKGYLVRPDRTDRKMMCFDFWPQIGRGSFLVVLASCLEEAEKPKKPHSESSGLRRGRFDVAA